MQETFGIGRREADGARVPIMASIRRVPVLR